MRTSLSCALKFHTLRHLILQFEKKFKVCDKENMASLIQMGMSSTGSQLAPKWLGWCPCRPLVQWSPSPGSFWTTLTLPARPLEPVWRKMDGTTNCTV